MTSDSPLGALTLLAGDDGLRGVFLPGHRHGPPPSAGDAEHPTARLAARQLGEYFAGERRAFDLPLAPAGTPFQRRVWAALAAIPYGETTTYGALAAGLGDPRAVRAVGLANGRNPLPIVVPCHRVIGADGSLVGYGGGLPAKRALLELEGALAPSPCSAALPLFP